LVKRRDKRHQNGAGSGLPDRVQLGSKPDQVVEGPGFRLERHGRYITIDTHRTEQEQQRLMTAMANSRDALFEEIRQKTEDLLSLLHSFNSLELLAHVSLRNSRYEPDSYEEFSSELRPHYIEHLALLELKDANYEVRSIQMPDGVTVQRAQHLLEEIFLKTHWYWVARGADPDRKGPPSQFEELRLRQTLYELVVRAPTYYHHWTGVLRALFDPDGVAARMKDVLGFDIESALRLVAAIPSLTEKRLSLRVAEARKHEEELRRDIYRFKTTGTYVGPSEMREQANCLRNLSDKECKKSIKAMTIAWAFFDLAQTLSFCAEEVADQASVSVAVARAFLDFFSVEFGSTCGDYLLPGLTHELKLRPVIRYGDRFFCPVPHLLLWALKPAIESRFKTESRDSGGALNTLWERYQRHRSDFLIRQALEYFRRMLPRAQIYKGLRYKAGVPGEEQDFELDGLVVFDRYAFFIEAKAGELSDPARRAAPDRLLRDLKGLVAEPHAQAKRAVEYVRSTADPLFSLPDGAQLNFDKALCEETFRIAVRLDHFDVLTASLSELREIGLLDAGELAWSVNLSDLRVLAETICVPVQFTHYLRWRIYLNRAGDVHGHDELNWLGVYLAEGPQLLEVPRGFGELSFTSYLTEFDSYYLYEMGERTKPAKRPAQYMPKDMISLLEALEVVGGYGYAAVGEALLSLGFKDRDELAAGISRAVSRLRTRTRQSEMLSFSSLLIELRPFVSSFEDCRKAAASLRASHGCDALVFSLNGPAASGLVAWGYSEN
jgi:hypothetical protein